MNQWEPFLEDLGESIAKQTAIIATSRDNLFSANHRFHMIQDYRYTEAQRITIGDLTDA